MKSVKYLLLGVILFSLCRVNGQGVNLRLGLSSLAGLPPAVYNDSVYTDSVTIYNDSATSFVGTIAISGTINGHFYTGDTIGAPLYYQYSQLQDIIPAHDSVTRALIVTVTTPPFVIGSSGVVIWPIAIQHNVPVNISDTISKTVTVLYPAGIDELTARDLKVYMDGQQLIVQNNGEYLLKNVRLYDVAGNLLRQQELSISGAVNMGQYATGVYFAEITFADNTRAVVKIVNTHP